MCHSERYYNPPFCYLWWVKSCTVRLVRIRFCTPYFILCMATSSFVYHCTRRKEALSLRFAQARFTGFLPPPICGILYFFFLSDTAYSSSKQALTFVCRHPCPSQWKPSRHHSQVPTSASGLDSGSHYFSCHYCQVAWFFHVGLQWRLDVYPMNYLQNAIGHSNIIIKKIIKRFKKMLIWVLEEERVGDVKLFLALWLVVYKCYLDFLQKAH